MNKLKNKPKISAKTMLLVLASFVLFPQVSGTELPWLAKEYIVLFFVKLYFVTTCVIIPRLKES